MNKIFFKKYSNEKGISLIELVVAVSVFSLVVLAATGIFINSMKAQRIILAKQNVAENMRYTMEYMIKEIRMAKINPTATLTFERTAGIQLDDSNSPSDTIRFINSNNAEITYSLIGDAIKRDDGSGTFQPVSSDEVRITGLSYTLNNWNLANGPAPLITILIKAEALNGVGGTMELQTSVAPRIY